MSTLPRNAALADDFDPLDWEFEADEPDDDEIAEMNCGSRGHRRCDLAGTEYCDWSCPLHDEVFPPRKTRRRS